MATETPAQRILRMRTDGLSIDEISIATSIEWTEVNRILHAERAQERQRKKVRETLDRVMGPWSIK